MVMMLNPKKRDSQMNMIPSALMRENPFGNIELPEKWEWTVSALKLFRNCKRKFYWKYIACVTPKKLSSSLYIGTIAHDVLAKWYLCQGDISMEQIATEVITAAEASLDSAMWDQAEMDKAVITLETLAGMFSAYAEVYKDDITASVHSVEQRYSVESTLRNFSGKIDLVQKGENGKYTLWDHKTSAFIDDSYLSRLPLDTQIRGYAYLLYKNKLPPSHAIYNCIKKCALRRKSGETRNEFCERIKEDYVNRHRVYFHREVVQLSMDDLRAFEFELSQTDGEFRRILSNPEWRDPRAWGINCSYCNAYFKNCEYMTLCTQGMDASAKLMYEQTQRNVELGDTAE